MSILQVEQKKVVEVKVFITGIAIVHQGIQHHIPLQFPDSQRTGRERELESEMRNLIAAFLNTDPAQRLGAGSSGPSDIKNHPFFKTVNWSLFR
jgi:hypothetical protein